MAYIQPSEEKRCIFSLEGCYLKDEDTRKPAALPNFRATDHQTPQGMKPTQDFLSSELNKLSVQERSKAMEDLHCVGEELKENDVIVQKSLMEFQRVLEEGDYAMYDKAVCLNRDYVENPLFRLWFLRANMHDIKASVRQMEYHLAQKAKYFGEDKIARDITHEDIDDTVKELLLSGLVHIQEARDRTGRVVLIIFNDMLGRWTPETFIRGHYFVMHSILVPIPEVQKKGLVVVYYDMSKGDKKFSLPSLQLMLKIKKYRSSVPVRFSAVHLCLKTTWTENLAPQNSFLEMALKYLNQYTIVRTRAHYGSDMEIQHSLRSYGIVQYSLPVDMDGNVRSSIVNGWLHKYFAAERNKSHAYLAHFQLFSDDTDEAIESAGDSPLLLVSNGGSAMEEITQNPTAQHAPSLSESDRPENEERAALPKQVGLIEPTIQDVLLGRGVRLMKHPGNVRFREFIDGYKAEYDKAPRSNRRKVSMKVVSELKSEGVRFLQKGESSIWVESDISEAVNKVQQLFRSRRKIKK